VGETVKIDIYSIMRNEEIILPYFLRHYGSFADRIFVFEDESTDRTHEILAAHPKVTLLPVEKHGIDHVYWNTQLWTRYEQLSRGVADWVMCVEADEFVYHPKLLEVLRKEMALGTQLINCTGLTMVSDSLPTTDGQIYDEITKGLRDHWSSKWVVFSPDIHVVFHIGRHPKQGLPVAELTEGAVMRKHTGIKLLHYRYLGPQYYIDRCKSNVDRHWAAGKPAAKFNEKSRYNMPDYSSDYPIPWFERHKGEAVECI